MAEGKRSYAWNANNPFQTWLELQLKLQQEVFVDPRHIEDEEMRSEFLLWNAFAATDEIHEAMQEVGWKPWATSRHLNNAAFIGEIVDALHFIGNMILTAAESRDETPESLASKVWSEYQNKVQKNIQRQLWGYDGVSDKCPKCHRELVRRYDVIGTYIGCLEHGRVGNGPGIPSTEHH